MLRLATAIPGFGGYFYDREGSLNVFLKDLGRADQARQTLADVARRGRNGRLRNAGSEIVFREGQFDFIELAKWRDSFTTVARELEGMHSLNADEGTNRVIIGVQSSEVEQAVRERAKTLGVPDDALDIRIGGQGKDLDNLDSFIFPAVGGIRIARYDQGFRFDCTIGFNTFDGTAFLTNSHCSFVRGPDPDPAVQWQPNQSIGYFAGFEAYDPPYFSNATDGCCPSVLQRCRYSDAALFTYFSVAAPGSAGQGIIKRTAFASFGTGAHGSKEIVGDMPITEEEGNFTPQGALLDKIGSASGWTYGYTIATCADVLTATYWYLCQDIVSAEATNGDSGAPVFEYRVNPISGAASVKLFGLLRGWDPTYHGFTFSPLSAIFQEVGYSSATQ